jgi:hypothetical protein
MVLQSFGHNLNLCVREQKRVEKSLLAWNPEFRHRLHKILPIEAYLGYLIAVLTYSMEQSPSLEPNQ